MKNLFRKVFFIIALIATCTTTVHAQTASQQRISREQLAEVQAKAIAYKLALTGPVANKFVKTYCDYQKDIWALGPRHHIRKATSSEEANEVAIKQRFALSEKILEIRQKYYKKYSQFLTQTQIERVYEEERLLKKNLTNKARQRRKLHNKANK